MSVDSWMDVFFFYICLVCILDVLCDGNGMWVLEKLILMVNGFGGGIQIGFNLKWFNDQYVCQGVNG